MQEKMQFQSSETSQEESGLLPEIKPDTKEDFGKPHKYNSTTKCWDKQAKQDSATTQVTKTVELSDAKPAAGVA